MLCSISGSILENRIPLYVHTVTYLWGHKLFFVVLNIFEKKAIKLLKPHNEGQVMKKEIPLQINKLKLVKDRANDRQSKTMRPYGNRVDPPKMARDPTSR